MAEGTIYRRPRRQFEKTEAEVLSHPLRVRILELANERDISATTFIRGGYANVLLEHLEEHEALTQVAYHCRKLAEWGCVELVDSRPNRGSVEQVYRGVARAYFSDEAWAAMHPERRADITGVVFQGLMARAQSALLEDTFDKRPDRWLTWVQMFADEQAWTQLCKLCQGMSDSIEALREETEKRIEAGGGAIKTSPITWGMLSFESPGQ